MGNVRHAKNKVQGIQSSSASTTKSAPFEGKQLHEYTKWTKIGDGGFGVVFKAWHKKDKEWYAIKQVDPVDPVDMADTEQSRNRVLREVHFLADLDHPHIVRYYDAWLERPPPSEELPWVDSNQPCLYIRMEWCSGPTLREWLGQNQLPAQRPISQTLDWFSQLVSAVKHIHGKDLIHRDIKPENIFIGSSRDGATPVLKIGDFELATYATTSFSSGVSGDVSKSLSIVGTPSYMSPEQPSGHYTNSTDIFSLGLVFLEMVHPFKTDRERYAAFGALRAKQRPAMMNKLDKNMDALISWMTVFEPEKRPTASKLDNELKKKTAEQLPESVKEIGVGSHAETNDGTDSNVKSEAGTSSTHSNESVRDNETTVAEVTACVRDLGPSPGSTADFSVSGIWNELIEHSLAVDSMLSREDLEEKTDDELQQMWDRAQEADKEFREMERTWAQERAKKLEELLGKVEEQLHDTPEDSDLQEELEKKTVEQLQDILMDRSLLLDGIKGELIERLLQEQAAKLSSSVATDSMSSHEELKAAGKLEELLKEMDGELEKIQARAREMKERFQKVLKDRRLLTSEKKKELIERLLQAQAIKSSSPATTDSMSSYEELKKKIRKELKRETVEQLHDTLEDFDRQEELEKKTVKLLHTILKDRNPLVNEIKGELIKRLLLMYHIQSVADVQGLCTSPQLLDLSDCIKPVAKDQPLGMLSPHGVVLDSQSGKQEGADPSIAGRVIVMAARHDIMERPVLGAPVRLGMLYDAHTSKFIYGHSLWDDEFIVERCAVEFTPQSNFSVSSGDNKLEMAKTLDIKADLCVKIMCGLVEIGGAAKYLKQEKKSHKEAHVSLTYRCKSGIESLTMKHLAPGNVQYTDLLSGRATHVVTAVEYGGIMVFDFKKSEASVEDKEKAETKLKSALDCSGVKSALSSLSSSNSEASPTFGVGASHMNNELSFASGFQCECYGDVELDKIPRTLPEAMDLLTDVPKIFRRVQRTVNEHQLFGVPVMVHLLPLHAIDPKASLPSARSIGVHHFEDCQDVLQSLTNAELDLKELQENDVCKLADEPKKEIEDALTVVKDYRKTFLRRLSDLLAPQASAEENYIEKLRQLIDAYKRSPFAEEYLRALVETKSKEFRTLSKYVNRLCKEIPTLTVIFQEGEIEDLLSTDDSRPLVAFSLGALLTEPHKHLQAMKNFLKSSTTRDTYQLESGWLNSEEAKKLPDAVRRFIDFARKNRARTRFALVHYPVVSEKTPGLALTFNADGQDSIFQLPEASSANVVREEGMRVIGKLPHPRFGANSSVKVLNKTNAHMKLMDTTLNHGCMEEQPSDIPPWTILRYGVYGRGLGCDHAETWSVGDTHMVLRLTSFLRDASLGECQRRGELPQLVGNFQVSIWKRVLGHIYVGQSNTVKLRVWLQTPEGDDSTRVVEKQASVGGTTIFTRHGQYEFHVTIGSGQKATHVLEIRESDRNREDASTTVTSTHN